MAHLPGWDRERLATAPLQDVAAARLIAFVHEVKPVLVRDFEGEIADLADRTPEQQKHYERQRRAKAVEALKSGWRLQVELRKQLGLDDGG